MTHIISRLTHERDFLLAELKAKTEELAGVRLEFKELRTRLTPMMRELDALRKTALPPDTLVAPLVPEIPEKENV